MDPSYLADKIAVALDQVVPHRFRVYESQGMVFIEGGDYLAASEVAEIIDTPGDVKEQAETISRDALTLIREYVIDNLGEEWPAPGIEPAVTVSPTEIRLSYRDRAGTTVLRVPVIKW